MERAKGGQRAGVKVEGGSQSAGPGPGCWRETGAGSEGKEGLFLH